MNTGGVADGLATTYHVPVPTVGLFAPSGEVTELHKNWSMPAKAGAGFSSRVMIMLSELPGHIPNWLTTFHRNWFEPSDRFETNVFEL